MPKEYTECVKSEVARGKSHDTAQRICAISYYKRHGKTPRQAHEDKASLEFTPEEEKLFDLIEAVGPLFVREDE